MKMEKCILKYHGNLMKLVDSLKFSLWNFERWNPWTNLPSRDLFTRAKGWDLRIWDGKIESPSANVPSCSIIFHHVQSERFWNHHLCLVFSGPPHYSETYLGTRYTVYTCHSFIQLWMKHETWLRDQHWWNMVKQSESQRPGDFNPLVGRPSTSREQKVWKAAIKRTASSPL